MEPVYYPGLNCHLACVINIVDLLGLHHPRAYADLWSETDFTDEVAYNVYVSQRVFVNLKAMGIVIQALDWGGADRESVPNGAWLLVGMDTVHIPWHSVYGHFHGPHYFFARKEAGNALLCNDPVYQQKDIRIKAEDFLSAAFEVSHVGRVDAEPPSHELRQEAQAVLAGHPDTMERLRAAIHMCTGEGKKNLPSRIKYVTGMINNRYLFRRYLDSLSPIGGDNKPLFTDVHLIQWEAIRNGLHKATILKDNNSVVQEVNDLFSTLMEEEIAMAEGIISHYPFQCP